MQCSGLGRKQKENERIWLSGESIASTVSLQSTETRGGFYLEQIWFREIVCRREQVESQPFKYPTCQERGLLLRNASVAPEEVTRMEEILGMNSCEGVSERSATYLVESQAAEKVHCS